MKLLAIDTSTERASLALSIDGHCYSAELGEQRQHAQRLLIAIEQLFAKAELSLPQLDGIVFNRGPGSFTGIRIACSVAKGLAYAHDLAVYPVSSLASIAEELLFRIPDLLTQHQLLTLIDARMQQVYWSCYQQRPLQAMEFVSDLRDVVIEKPANIVVAGFAYQQYWSQLNPLIAEKITASYEICPNAAAMLRLVNQGEIHAISAAEAMPVYIRDQVTN